MCSAGKLQKCQSTELELKRLIPKEMQLKFFSTSQFGALFSVRVIEKWLSRQGT